MDLDLLFRALCDRTRRRLMDELAERDGQTLFELHVRLITWHGASLSRQALSKHLATLEEAGLLRTEWRWRSKHHFLEREPIRRAWKLWLGGFVHPERTKEETPHEDRADERARR
jgi:DNA-binding transcriptional ArsR family regulator